MKTRSIIIIASVVLVSIMLFLLYPKLEYETGRDTIAYYFNGRYQILDASGSLDWKDGVLYDFKNDMVLLERISCFQKLDNSRILFEGYESANSVELVYLIIDEKEGEYEIFDTSPVMQER